MEIVHTCMDGWPIWPSRSPRKVVFPLQPFLLSFSLSALRFFRFLVGLFCHFLYNYLFSSSSSTSSSFIFFLFYLFVIFYFITSQYFHLLLSLSRCLYHHQSYHHPDVLPSTLQLPPSHIFLLHRYILFNLSPLILLYETNFYSAKNNP